MLYWATWSFTCWSVTVIDGKISRQSTEADRLFCRLIEQSKYVDGEIIAAGLGLATVGAAIAAQELNIIIRIFASLTFVLSMAGTFVLFQVYLVRRIPHTIHASLVYTRHEITAWFWIMRHWLRLMIKASSRQPSREDDFEVGYLSLFVAFTLTSGLLGAWTALSIACTFGVIVAC